MSQPTCPECSAAVYAGAIFCDNCGADLRLAAPHKPPATNTPQDASPAPAFSVDVLPVYEPPISAGRKSPAARLVILGSNASLNLPVDQVELVVGREDAAGGVFPEINLEPYGAQDAGVSRRHIRLRHAGENWTAEDLNTVNGTFINHQRLPAAQPTLLKHGDELRLGNMKLIFYQDE